MTDERVQRRLAAILAADVVDYYRLMQRDRLSIAGRGHECATQTSAAKPVLKEFLRLGNLGQHYSGRNDKAITQYPANRCHRSGM
jgi:hypothetical protein